MPFAVRRAAHSAAALAAIGVVTALAAASIATVWALAGRAYDAGVDGMLAQADPRDRSVVVLMPLSSSADAEASALEAAVRAALDRQPVDVLAARTALAPATTAVGEVALELLSDAGARSRAELVSGDWPTGPDEVALGEPAAQRLGVDTGATLTLTSGDVRVAGVWRAVDASAPAWAGDPAVASGQAGDAIGPVLVADDAALADAPQLRTRLTIVPERLTVASAADMRRALDEVVAVVATPVGRTDAGPAALSGGLASTLSQALAAVDGARVALLVPLAALAVVASIIIGVMVFALGRARADDLALLIARGARRRDVWLGFTGEVAAIALVGGVVGAAVALVTAPPTPALATGAVTVVVVSSIAAAVAGSAVARAGRAAPPRSRPVTVSMLMVALALGGAAAFTVAQGMARGGPVQPGGEADPVAIAAPWFVLTALALGVALVTGPAAAAAELATRRSTGFAARFGVLQLARRPHSVLAGILCLVLAAAGLALAGTLAVGVSRGDAAASAAVGAELRVEVDAEATVDERNPALPVNALRGQPAIRAAWPAVAAPTTVGDAPLRLLATSPAGFASMHPTDATAELLTRLPAVDAPTLTGDTLTVEVTAVPQIGGVPSDGSEPEASVLISAWGLDDDGAPVRWDVGAVPVDGAPHELTAPVGTATRLLALDAAGRNMPPQGLSIAATVSDAAGAVALSPATASITERRGTRLSAVADAPTGIPAVITTTLADAVHAPIGGTLNLAIRGATRDVAVEVIGIVPALPGVGGGPGLALDAGTLTAALVGVRSAVLIPTTLLITASDGDTAAADAATRAWATHAVRVRAGADAGAQPISAPTLGLTAASALVGALLGVVGFIVVFAGAARDRRAEAVPLRSFGFGGAAQRRSRVVERLVAALFALVAGALAGWLTGVIVGPLLLPALTGVAP